MINNYKMVIQLNIKMSKILNTAPFLFIISDYFIYQTCDKNSWNAMNCYFLFTFPVLFATFLMYTRTYYQRAYLSLFFANLLNLFWTMIGILLSSSFRIEQYLWVRLFVYGWSIGVCYRELN